MCYIEVFLNRNKKKCKCSAFVGRTEGQNLNLVSNIRIKVEESNIRTKVVSDRWSQRLESKIITHC